MPHLSPATCLLWSLGGFLLAGQAGVERVPPSAGDQKEVIEAVRDHVLKHTSNASNLAFTLVRRHYSYAVRDGRGFWQFEREQRTSGDAATAAEFVSMLREPFEPVTRTSFEWDHWGKLRDRLTYVFAYSVERARSGWRLRQVSPDVAIAYSGLIYVDMERRVVLRITRKAGDLPATTSQVREASTVLDYDLAKAGVNQAGLPFRAEELVRSEKLGTRSVVEIYPGPVLLPEMALIPRIRQ